MQVKRVVFLFLQFFLFLVVFAAGSFFPPFHIERVLSTSPEGTRVFIFDGALLMAALFVAILLLQLVRKRLAASAPWTAVAFLMAAVTGYAARFGFLTR